MKPEGIYFFSSFWNCPWVYCKILIIIIIKELSQVSENLLKPVLYKHWDSPNTSFYLFTSHPFHIETFNQETKFYLEKYTIYFWVGTIVDLSKKVTHMLTYSFSEEGVLLKQFVQMIVYVQEATSTSLSQNFCPNLAIWKPTATLHWLPNVSSQGWVLEF
jgi:hypothetical protein